MFRLSKVTDYGIVLLAQLAQSEDRSAQNAQKLAHCYALIARRGFKLLLHPWRHHNVKPLRIFWLWSALSHDSYIEHENTLCKGIDIANRCT